MKGLDCRRRVQVVRIKIGVGLDTAPRGGPVSEREIAHSVHQHAKAYTVAIVAPLFATLDHYWNLCMVLKISANIGRRRFNRDAKALQIVHRDDTRQHQNARRIDCTGQRITSPAWAVRN